MHTSRRAESPRKDKEAQGFPGALIFELIIRIPRSCAVSILPWWEHSSGNVLCDPFSIKNAESSGKTGKGVS